MLYHTVGIYKTKISPKPLSVYGASILVPVRNDAHNVLQLINCLLGQKNVPVPVQIIILDDHSQDGLYNVLEPYLYAVEYLPLPKDKQGKKQAIEYGISHAKHEIIITTDADCTMNENWLYTVLSCFENEVQFVSAPVFLKANTLFEKIQQTELMGLVGIGAGAIYHHKPNLCNGANIAYRKNAFIAVNGYEGSIHLASGDDELLMHKLHAHYKNPKSICFCKEYNAIVYTPAQSTLKQFAQQRKRWISKAMHYQRKGLTLQLILLYGFYFVLFISTMLSVGFKEVRTLALILWTAKMLSEYGIMIQMIRFFRQNIFKSSLVFVCSQIFQVLYVLWAGIVSLRPDFTWKGRKYE
jgi:cellulose synthase/poly-beta-1,6-N-acetylglucosamine synthase-like glycosyltransferase